MIRNIRDYGSTPPFLSHPLSNNLRLLISQQVHTPTLFRRPIIPLGRVQCGFCLFLSYLTLLLFSIVVLRFTLIHESYHHQCTYFHPPFSFPLSVPSRCPCVSASSHARGVPDATDITNHPVPLTLIRYLPGPRILKRATSMWILSRVSSVPGSYHLIMHLLLTLVHLPSFSFASLALSYLVIPLIVPSTVACFQLPLPSLHSDP